LYLKQNSLNARSLVVVFAGKQQWSSTNAGPINEGFIRQNWMTVRPLIPTVASLHPHRNIRAKCSGHSISQRMLCHTAIRCIEHILLPTSAITKLKDTGSSKRMAIDTAFHLVQPNSQHQ
jgi:hypothetical protein